MTDDERPDPVQLHGSVGGGDQNDNDQNDNPPNGHQQSPSSPLPDFDDVGELPDGVPQGGEIKEEEIIASPIILEAQMQIEADNQLAQTIHADEQMGVDRALAQQLQESHPITVPRQWLQNGQPSDSRDTPGARSSNCIELPDPSHPAEHHQLLPGSNRR